MSRTIDYYFTPQSPWTYLGHARFAAIAKSHGAAVRVRPIDFGAVFPVSGGLPLGKRAPQRQAYRLVELARFSRHLDIPLNPKPKFFPVASDDAAKLIIAVDLHDGTDIAMKLCGAIFAAVWVQERNIADPKVLEALVAECGLPARRVEQSLSQAVQERYEDYTQEAIDTKVFGAPSYVIDGEIFWGQDRLEFVERALRQ
ncbi:2-hydroxychromene-2-carboxylate isomerase [Variovorax ureilyticus]|uniref:2-hydroxychromene-2-carboxylate isomerase n=1 Tax=Variovorax ureilyticus TaxID=1836198 RepID=UPI003D67EA90